MKEVNIDNFNPPLKWKLATIDQAFKELVKDEAQ